MLIHDDIVTEADFRRFEAACAEKIRHLFPIRSSRHDAWFDADGTLWVRWSWSSVGRTGGVSLFGFCDGRRI